MDIKCRSNMEWKEKRPSDKPENGLVTRVTFQTKILKLFIKSAPTIGTDSGEAMKSGRHSRRWRATSKIRLGKLEITLYTWQPVTGSRWVKAY